ncbi:hypothetical protein [Delftia acidovorans]|uniref:hypothetical protein n=1 Tax=Delftia acidovorans TaxID=80866 RepID=UPI0028AB0183|nr:hypothetical protein [Delftia acidovorans]
MRIEILNPDGSVENTIIASPEFAERLHPGAWRICAHQDAQPLVAVPQHISVGAFYDRFGPAKWAILSDESPQVRAVVRDASVRKYIDLGNADLPAGLAILQAAGHAIDPAAILDAPIQPHELP